MIQRFLVAAIAAAVCSMAPAAHALPQDPTAPGWSQPRGVAAGTSAVDVAPVLSTPVESWRVKFTSLESEPVAAGGALYVVGTQRQGRRLYAHDLKTGKWMATSSPLDGTKRAYVAVWQGHVAVVEREGITVFAHRGATFTTKGKEIAGSFPYPPCAFQGHLFVNDAGGRLHCIDMRTAKEVAEVDGGWGRPAIARAESDGSVLLATIGVGRNFVLITHWIDGLGTKAVRFEARDREFVGAYANGTVDGEAMSAAFLARVRVSSDDKKDTWFAYSPEPLVSTKKDKMNAVMLPKALSWIVTDPAVAGDAAYGFSKAGSLIRFRADGKYSDVLPNGVGPSGARSGGATIARGVMYLGNWAVDIESSRVLWCDPTLAPSSPLFPLGDQMLVYVSKDSELVGLFDPHAGAITTEPVARATTRRKLSMPGSGDGVVLADGQRVAGKIARVEGGGVKVQPPSGAAETFAPRDLALVESGGAVDLVGEEYPVYQACWGAAEVKLFDAIEERFEEYRKNGFADDSQRLLRDARALGMSAARADAMERRLGSAVVNTNSNAAGQRAFFKKEEDRARERACAALLATADWCRSHDLLLAASVLVRRADAVQPSASGVRDRAKALLPAGFPDAERDDAPMRWLELASAILPVGGSLLAPGDAAWASAAVTPWNQGAFGLRTKSILLFSLERDASIVGTCLSRGEVTVRVLDRLLGNDPTAVRSPLDVRVHRTRDEYLGEFGDAAKKALEWTAGYYLPTAHVSRFYVPRNEASKDPLERSLEKVLVHEITHHYVSDRWSDAARREGEEMHTQPGFWIVEGFARFVEDQVVEMDRRGPGLDDDTVMSIDAASHIEEKQKLIPLATLLDLSQQGFQALPEEPIATVQLRNTIGAIEVRPRSVFYEESGSLVFFLVNRAGADKRAKLLDYLKRWYEGRVEKESWTSLGYASADELEAEYVAFLRQAGR